MFFKHFSLEEEPLSSAFAPKRQVNDFMLAAATSNVSFKVSDSDCVRMETSSGDNFKSKHEGFIAVITAHSGLISSLFCSAFRILGMLACC